MHSGKTLLAGVIGWPVTHSLSPRLHSYWLHQYGIEGSYVPLPVRPEDLKDVMKALPKMGMRGCNLTIPHKELALEILDRVDEEARTIGAANTIVIDENGNLCGFNTDAYGFAENIRPHLRGRHKAVVLGAGGAARAVCYALKKEGFAEIVITNRTQARAEALAESLGGGLRVQPWEKRESALEKAELLVNTTSLGLESQPPLELDLQALPGEALVTDIVYKPLQTPLLLAAEKRGHPVVDGLGMLLHQAVPGFEAWFGVRPAVTDELRQHVLYG